MLQKIFMDTSVLVSALVENHPAHDRCFPWLAKALSRQIQLIVSTHTLAELFAVLTRLPIQPRISPGVARRLISANIEKSAHVVSLDGNDYSEVLNEMAALNLSGGVIYDALGAAAAKKAGATRLLTLNEKDFRRVWPDAGTKIAVP